MSYDLKLTRATSSINLPISAASAIIQQEGVLLCRVIENSVEMCTLVASPSGSEVVLGFAKLADALPDVTSTVEDLVVPTAPATLQLNLRNGNLLVGFIRVYDVTTSAALTIDPVFAGTPAAGTVKVDFVHGFLKFNTAQGGNEVLVTYRYQLTQLQAIQLFGQRNVNNQGLHAQFGQMEVGAGTFELWTDEFDSSADYTTPGTLKLGPNGTIVTSGAGPVLTGAVVIGVPSVANPRLGIRYVAGQ